LWISLKIQNNIVSESISMADEVCTTQQAASLLGMSVTSVQQLVEAGEIEAWKTRGGHRRIPLSAVQAFKAAVASKGHVGAAFAAATVNTLSVLLVEDNALQRGIYETQISSWKLPLDLRVCENGYKALIDITSVKPDVLLLDIVMQGIDGYEIMQTVMSYPEFAEVDIAIITSLSLEDLARRGGVPVGVTYFPKPVSQDELRGYIRACCARKARRHVGS
jgi:excisionase family DNA binding protein